MSEENKKKWQHNYAVDFNFESSFEHSKEALLREKYSVMSALVKQVVEAFSDDTYLKCIREIDLNSNNTDDEIPAKNTTS